MSRLVQTQHRKNIRKIYIFGLLSILSIVIFIFVGIPALAKIAGLITNITQGDSITDTSDTTPPAPPRIDSLPEATNEFSIQINGSTESGVDVIILINNAKKEILANNSGKFSLSYELKNGENTISAYVVDAAGNESQKTNEFIVIFDNDPPELVISEPSDTKEFYGTKQRQVSIKGVTETGIDLSVNDRPVAVDSNGEYTYTTTLSEGDNNFNFKAQDLAGNTKEESITLKFTP